MTGAPPLDLIRCVVFDFDGTLVESNPVKRDTYYEIFSGVEGSAAVLERVLLENPEANRYGVIGLARAALQGGDETALPSAEELALEYGRICEDRVSTCAAVPGAVAALESLQGDFPLFIDSATPEEPLRRIVARRGWTSFFRDILGGPASKAENLQAIADRVGVLPDALLLVGDGPPDLRAATEFGCAFAGFEEAAPQLTAHPKLAVLAPLALELCSRSAAWGAPRGRKQAPEAAGSDRKAGRTG